jgi:glutamate-1-semialdehyde 2,1-aminomutase
MLGTCRCSAHAGSKHRGHDAAPHIDSSLVTSSVPVSPPESRYVETTPRSAKLFEAACRSMPGGVTRNTVHFAPHPLYIERGEGCYVWDVDGTRRLDAISNYSAQILGHAHPAVVEAVTAQVAKGTGFAAATELEAAYAELLCRRVPSLELVRFTNSGTEATMFAMRLARVHTGRSKIARMEGGYHGTHEYAEVSSSPDPAAAGLPGDPLSVADSPGTPNAVLRDTVVLPFNDVENTERIIRTHANELAAVIVEPFMGLAGVILPERGYLEMLRALTCRLGIVLIFDEVISLRIASGGAQSVFGVTPDLTAMGKMIGGGLPMGAFGGARDIMERLTPGRIGSLPHGGTFNGNPLGLAAGLATMQHLTPEVYDALAAKGDRLRRDIAAIFAAHEIPAYVSGIASVANIHFSERPVRSYRDKVAADGTRLRTLFLSLLNNGVLIAPRGMIALSTPTTDADLQLFVDAVERAVPALR